MKILHEIFKGLPAQYYKLATYACSFSIGLVLAVVFNYTLYRLGLPSKPFIYVAF